MLKRILSIGTILLFIGISIQPAFAVNIRHSIVNNVIEGDCNCKEVTNADIVIVERWLDRVEVYSKLLLVLNKNNPEIKEKCEELLEIIYFNGKWDFPIICYILNESLTNFFAIGDAIFEWLESTDEGTLEQLIAGLCCLIFLEIMKSPIMTIIILISFILDCWEFDPYL